MTEMPPRSPYRWLLAVESKRDRWSRWPEPLAEDERSTETSGVALDQ